MIWVVFLEQMHGRGRTLLNGIVSVQLNACSGGSTLAISVPTLCPDA